MRIVLLQTVCCVAIGSLKDTVGNFQLDAQSTQSAPTASGVPVVPLAGGVVAPPTVDGSPTSLNGNDQPVFSSDNKKPPTTTSVPGSTVQSSNTQPNNPSLANSNVIGNTNTASSNFNSGSGVNISTMQSLNSGLDSTVTNNAPPQAPKPQVSTTSVQSSSIRSTTIWYLVLLINI